MGRGSNNNLLYGNVDISESRDAENQFHPEFEREVLIRVLLNNREQEYFSDQQLDSLLWVIEHRHSFNKFLFDGSKFNDMSTANKEKRQYQLVNRLVQLLVNNKKRALVDDHPANILSEKFINEFFESVTINKIYYNRGVAKDNSDQEINQLIESSLYKHFNSVKFRSQLIDNTQKIVCSLGAKTIPSVCSMYENFKIHLIKLNKPAQQGSPDLALCGYKFKNSRAAKKYIRQEASAQDNIPVQSYCYDCQSIELEMVRKEKPDQRIVSVSSVQTVAQRVIDSQSNNATSNWLKTSAAIKPKSLTELHTVLGKRMLFTYCAQQAKLSQNPIDYRDNPQATAEADNDYARTRGSLKSKIRNDDLAIPLLKRTLENHSQKYPVYL